MKSRRKRNGPGCGMPEAPVGCGIDGNCGTFLRTQNPRELAGAEAEPHLHTSLKAQPVGSLQKKEFCLNIIPRLTNSSRTKTTILRRMITLMWKMIGDVTPQRFLA